MTGIILTDLWYQTSIKAFSKRFPFNNSLFKYSFSHPSLSVLLSTIVTIRSSHHAVYLWHLFYVFVYILCFLLTFTLPLLCQSNYVVSQLIILAYDVCVMYPCSTHHIHSCYVQLCYPHCFFLIGFIVPDKWLALSCWFFCLASYSYRGWPGTQFLWISSWPLSLA